MRATMVGTEVISDAVRLACRAPSLHNSQPEFGDEGDTVSLFGTPTGSSGRRTARAGKPC